MFTDSTLEKGNHYKYAVTAYNSLGGESAYSDAQEVIPSVVPSKLAAPTRVTHSTDSVTLQWQEPTYDGSAPVTTYKLYWKADYQSSYTEVYSGMALSYRVTGLRSGFYHTFKVLCSNQIGDSEMSASSVAILTALAPVDAPSSLTLVKRSASEMTFEWDSPVDKGGLELTSYIIYMAEGDGLFSVLLDTPAIMNPSITVHTETDLTPSQLYKFKVSASNFVGEGPLSSAIEVIAADMPSRPAQAP